MSCVYLACDVRKFGTCTQSNCSRARARSWTDKLCAVKGPRYNRSPMRRFVVLLLMFLLPLQVSWAIAGSYCTHEQSSATRHFGHHTHVHQAQPDDGDSRSSPQQHQDDCSSCHAVLFSVLEDSVKLGDVSPRRATPPKLVPSLPSVSPDEPERPKWYLVV